MIRPVTRSMIESSRPEMLPDVPEMLPESLLGEPEILPGLPEMLPASAAEDIAKVKSDAQRIDLKLFILILLVIGHSSVWVS
jgi:hypothetical protein